MKNKKKIMIITMAIILAIVIIVLITFLVKINTKRTMVCTITKEYEQYKYISKKKITYDNKKMILTQQLFDINKYNDQNLYNMYKTNTITDKRITFDDEKMIATTTYEQTKILDEAGNEINLKLSEYRKQLLDAGYTCK